MLLKLWSKELVLYISFDNCNDRRNSATYTGETEINHVHYFTRQAPLSSRL